MADNLQSAAPAEHLAVFAKYWQPGDVKTRLAAAIGQSAASKVYRSFIRTLTDRFGRLAVRRTVVFTPSNRRGEFAKLVGNRWSLAAQTEGDLGSRMRDFFVGAFAAGARRVVLIGSDSPTIPMKSVEEAFEYLHQHPVVLGPTADGGYYLLGATDRVPPIFHDVTWSSPAVWQQTVARLERANTPYAQLQPWYDVDDLGGLRRLDRELQDDVGRDSAWSDLARTVRQALEVIS